MSPAKKAASGRSGAVSKAKKAPTRGSAAKTGAKKTTSRQKPAAKSTTKKTAAKKSPTSPKRSMSRKTASKGTAAKKTAAKKTAAKKTAKKAPAKKAPAKKAVTKKAPAKKTGAKKPSPTSAAATPAKPPVKKPVTRPSPPAPPKRKVRAVKFTADQLKKIRASLADKQADLEQRERELDEASFDATQSDITGEVGIDEDFADAGTATFERERDLSIRNNIRDLIDQQARAIQRIDEGNYGTCERCGQPIDGPRLRELPAASLCLDCKRREERAR